MITIYTDGSARGNPGPGGWGAVIWVYDSEPGQDNRERGVVTEIGGGEEHTTNNRMELTAAIKALDYIEAGDEIEVNTDSEYVLKGITSWVRSWQANNWRTAARKPVINQDLWQELLRVTDGKKIKWSLVPGHAGVAANERCDVIATSSADKLRPELYHGPREDYPISL